MSCMTRWYGDLEKLLANFLGNGPGPLIGYNRGGMVVEILFSPGKEHAGTGSPCGCRRVCRGRLLRRRALSPSSCAHVQGCGRTGERACGGAPVRRPTDRPTDRPSGPTDGPRVAALGRRSDWAARTRDGRTADGGAGSVRAQRTVPAPTGGPARAHVIGPDAIGPRSGAADSSDVTERTAGDVDQGRAA